MKSLVSCRVRLARNVKEQPFPHRMSRAERRKLCSRCAAILTRAAAGQEFEAIHLDEGEQLRAEWLVEQHLISPEFAAETAPHTAILSRDRSVSVMVCEEDHLRIQTFGLDFQSCLEKARRIDSLLDEELPAAFDESLGYLTACPTNLGTGLRASVMLHLPCLAETNQIAALSKQMQGAGLSIRGLYGEGSRAGWGYFQISNALTLGPTETELCSAVQDIAGRLDTLETETRNKLRSADHVGFANRVWRAWGLLCHARRISTAEAMEALSRLRMGSLTGDIKAAVPKLDTLGKNIWPAGMLYGDPTLTDKARRDEARATLIRRSMEDIG